MTSNQEIKSEEYVGWWWLPQAFEQKIMGVMTSSEEGIYLELFGGFQLLENLNIHNECQLLILGLSKEGKLLTCHKARRVRYTLSCPGTTTEKYQIDSVFIGVHFNSDENIKFHEIIIKCNYLSDWVYRGQPKFLEKWNDECFKIDDSNFDNCFLNLPKLEATTPDAIISIQPSICSSDNWFERKIERYARISIKLVKQELNLVDFYFRYLYPLQNFLSLATNKNNYIVKINAFSRHGHFSTDELDNRDNLIDILAPFIREEKPKISKDMLFRLKDIENEFSLYVQRWLNINEEIKHICDIYFGVRYAEQNMYGENSFHNLVQILESYHRIKISQGQDNDEAHQQKLKVIYNSCPPEYENWLKEKLTFSHEPSLKNRLEELIKKYLQVIKPLVKNENAFIKRVKDTRNYYTHYDQLLRKKTATGEELFRINQILSYIIQSCFLNELGCTPERCADLMKLNNEYNYAIVAIQKADFKW